MDRFKEAIRLTTLSILASIPVTLKLVELYLGLSGLVSSIITVVVVYLLLGVLIGDIKHTLLCLIVSMLIPIPIGAAVLTYQLVILALSLHNTYLFMLYTFLTKFIIIIILIFIPLAILSSMLGVTLYDRFIER